VVTYPGYVPTGNTCERHVGRLLEIRVDAGYRDASEVGEIVAAMITQIARLRQAEQLVVATDSRNCIFMAEDATARVADGLRRTNARITRGGALLPNHSSVAMLQYARMLRENNNPERRGFTDPRALVAWLAEVLTAEEIARLHAFLGLAGTP
jgi:hypothetical protein